MNKPQPWELFRFLDKPWKNMWIYVDKHGEASLFVSTDSGLEEILFSSHDMRTFVNFDFSSDVDRDSVHQEWTRDDYAEQLGEGKKSRSGITLLDKFGKVVKEYRECFTAPNLMGPLSNSSLQYEENKSVKKKIPFEWEYLKATSLFSDIRSKVHGGWLIRHIEEKQNYVKVLFIPDPNHEWEIDSDETTGENDV